MWRGETPQDGRYREFHQCDADVIAENELSVHHDVELTVLLYDTVAALLVPPVSLRVNNRKILKMSDRAAVQCLALAHIQGTDRAVIIFEAS